jgi:hypothetical protein
MKNEAKLMKTLSSSDMRPMVQSTVKNAAVSLVAPVSTALIWGFDAVPGANSAIWGTLAIGDAVRRQDFSAIWGTSGIWTPIQPAGKHMADQRRLGDR